MPEKKEAFEKVAKDEARKLSTVQEIMIRSTDYLRHIIAPAVRQGGVTMSYSCPHCSRPRLVGLWEKIHKVVVRNLWRKVRLEETEQAFGRTNRRQF